MCVCDALCHYTYKLPNSCLCYAILGTRYNLLCFVHYPEISICLSGILATLEVIKSNSTSVVLLVHVERMCWKEESINESRITVRNFTCDNLYRYQKLMYTSFV